MSFKYLTVQPTQEDVYKQEAPRDENNETRRGYDDEYTSPFSANDPNYLAY